MLATVQSSYFIQIYSLLQIITAMIHISFERWMTNGFVYIVLYIFNICKIKSVFLNTYQNNVTKSILATYIITVVNTFMYSMDNSEIFNGHNV